MKEMARPTSCIRAWLFIDKVSGLLFALALAVACPAQADQSEEPFHLSVQAANHALLYADDVPGRGETQHTAPDLEQTNRRTFGIIAGSAAAVALYGHFKWWQDGFTTDFNPKNEGWFGHNTYSGGADKLGHFFTGYAGTRLSASAFEWAGHSRADALTLAAWTTFGILTGVEVLDGFSKEWHFSREDTIVNALGVGSALLMEKNPGLDRFLDFRILYWPSRESGREFNPFGDYSGQIYLLVGKASGVPAFRNHPLLRYLELAVGYGTRGSSDDGRDDEEIRRNVYVGLSLNISEVLRSTVFAEESRHKTWQKATDTFLEFVQVPGTAALYRHSLD